MSIGEQKYLAWCERMAAKAALEHSGLAPASSGNKVVDESYSSNNFSDTESFHSTSSRRHGKSANLKPTRRRTMSDPKVHDTKTVFQQARTGTWPRCARDSMSQSAPQPRPLIPRRRSSHLRVSSSSRPRSDLRSFHRESCQLFSSMDATITDSGYSSIHRSGSSRFASTASFQQSSMPTEATPRCSTSLPRPQVATVVSWKSEETRRMEYAKIDEAHSGLRGFCKKILPKCCQSRRSWRKFFEGKCDGDSVRRMRLPFSDDDEKAGS